MKTTPTTSRNAKLEPGLREIRAHWSTDERQQRAEAGRRRTREFLQLIDDAGDDGELWAVGAPTWDDLLRLQD